MVTLRFDKKARRSAAKTSAVPLKRVHSVAVWLFERTFAGSFDSGAGKYNLVFAPTRAAARAKNLELVGRLTITGPRGQGRSRNSVRATLASIQGGIGDPPIRRRVVATGASRSDTSTSQQKQQATAESDKTAEKAQEIRQTKSTDLPVTESTGPTSFTGVMYFHLEPLDRRTFGVPVDLSRVQLNLRLVPLDETAKTVNELFTALVDALQLQPDENQAASIIGELNQVFGS